MKPTLRSIMLDKQELIEAAKTSAVQEAEDWINVAIKIEDSMGSLSASGQARMANAIINQYGDQPS